MISLDLQKVLDRLMKDSKTVYMSTIGNDGRPQIRAVMNLRNEEAFPKLVGLWDMEDPFSVMISTNTSSMKMEEIERDNRVTAYFCTPDRYHGLMLACDAEIIKDPEYKKKVWQEGWERYYPGGPDDPDYTLLRLRPRYAKGWKGGSKFDFDIE